MENSLKHIFDALVKVDNLLVWDGIKRPFFEAYHLHINDAAGEWSGLIRYCLTTSSARQIKDTAVVLALFVDKQGQKTVVTQAHDLLHNDVVHADHIIEIGTSFLSLAEMIGMVKQGAHSIQWELCFEDPVVSLRLLSHGLFYHVLFGATKFLDPRLLGFATGTLYIDGQKRQIKRRKISQGHLFGTQNFLSWQRASCNEFREDSEACFSVLRVKVSFLKRFSLTLTPVFILLEGKKYHAFPFFRWLEIQQDASDSLNWYLSFAKKGLKFDCHIQRTPTNTIGIKMDGPNGAVSYGYESPMAKIEIKISRKTKGHWQYYRTLSSECQGLFETVTPERIEGLGEVGG